MSKAFRVETKPYYFDPARAGKSLKEVGVDYLQIESRNITSRWFHSNEDVDLFIWLDEFQQIIKQQVSFCGQIVEWNMLDGLKTGVIIEEEFGDSKKVESSEIIQFDKQLQNDAIQLAIQVVQGIDKIEENVRLLILTNFGASAVRPKISDSRTIWQRFIKLLKK